MVYYLFIVNDFEVGTEAFKGKVIADTLLEKMRWVFTYSTPNVKKIKPKDRVLIYVAGKGNRYFYTNIEILDDIEEVKLTPSNSLEKMLYDMFPLSCNIRVIDIWEKPVMIAEVIDALGFISDKKNYGLFFRQSTKVIPEKDYNLIVEMGNRNN